MIEIISTEKKTIRRRRSKNNDVYHEEIPRVIGKPCYKRNKNAQIEYVRMVARLNDQEVKKAKWENFLQC